MGDTPVPIPNTTVKTQAADGTALETMWESRWPPDQKRKEQGNLLNIKQALESELCWEHSGDRSDLISSANPNQPGRAVTNWFYQ